MLTSAEVGKHVASLRERAGLKQNELARRVTWSPAVLSRVETGERSLSTDELDQLLAAIGTEEASRLGEVVHRNWRQLEPPPLGHPDQDVLWEAELALKELAQLAEKPDIKNVFLRRLTEYKDELSNTARLLVTRDHQVALIGTIGVGKSTALCRITGLEVAGSSTAPAAPVLESGGGGVTICEVHLRQGPDYGLIIEPRSDDEVRREVADFAAFLKTPEASRPEEADGGDGASFGLSKEVVRAIRNMARLTSRREKRPDGKVARTDPAMELAATAPDVRTLAIDILARMTLHQRDRRDIWHSQVLTKDPLVWLKKTFEQINNGRHPQFSLPERIEVVVPQPVLDSEFLSIRLVDTRGIDQTPERADLERHFYEPHTLTVLCSGFNQAPELATQQLLKRATAAGVRNLSAKAAILVFPRAGEALAMKDPDQGFSAETVEEGYELKCEEVEMRLRDLRLDSVPIHFFNAREDDPGTLRGFLLGRLETIRDAYRRRLKESIVGIRALIANFETEQVLQAQREAGRHLTVWLREHLVLEGASVKLEDSLLEALSHAHASTIKAAVRREGEWWKLDYAHQLGHGARTVAAASVMRRFEGFGAIAENLIQDADLLDARELVRQAWRIMEAGIDDILRKVQLVGTSVHKDGMKPDVSFWSGCASEVGIGYRDRVTQRNAKWFEHEAHRSYAEELRALIDREWGQLLDRLTPLLATD